VARTLGLDIGNRRIGVAVSDATKLIARPLCVIDRKMEDAIMRIAQIYQEQQADEVVIGYPYHADGRVSEQAKSVERFAEALGGRMSAPIHFCDERFSTQDAKDIIGETGKRRKKREPDDAIAAAVILQRYMDEIRGMDTTCDATNSLPSS
jgi:putative Holliday junction resolvase